jgi:hypothetical protein
MRVQASASLPAQLAGISGRSIGKAQTNRVSNVRDANRQPASVRTNSSVSSPTPTTAGTAKAVAGSELVGGAQDRFRRIAAMIPDQHISGGVAKTMLAEEGFRPQPVVLLYRVHASGPGMLPGPERDSGDRCSVGVQRVVILKEAGVVTVAEGLGTGELDSDRLADERGH